MTINLSDNFSQTSVHPNKNTFEVKPDTNAIPDGRNFGHHLSDLFHAQAASSAETDFKEKSLAEKPGQEIAVPFTMAGQVFLVAPQAGALQDQPLQTVALKAVTLGPHMSVITPTSSPPDSQSLQAFARAQGLDETAIHWLFGGHAGTTNTHLIANPGNANAVAMGHAIGLAETTKAVQFSPPQAPLAIQTRASAVQAAATLPGQNSGLATPLFGHAIPAAPVTATSHELTPGFAPHSLGLVLPAAQVTATSSVQNTGLAPHTLGDATPAAQVTATAHGPNTGLATHSLGQAVTAVQALWAMADAPDQTPKPTVTHSTEEIPPLHMLRMAPPAAIWMQRNVNPNLLQHNERAPKTAPISLSELDLGADWGGETLEQLLGSEGGTQSTGTQSTAYGNLVPRMDAQASHRNESPHKLGTAPELPDTNARSENIQNLADKMGQAVGQRILSEMERGQWHLKLSLRPATLGHIEVEMKMRSGEFDALFTAPNAVTRELLQEGLGKLRETLNQMGMNFAQIDVADGKSGKNDGNPTPGSFRGQPASIPAGHAENTIETTTRTPSIKNPAEGLDVLV